MLNFFKNKKTPLTNLFPPDFMDMHNHILPGIDDGAKNLEESVSLIQRMRGYGIKKFTCTPHIMEGVWENTPEIINQKLHELKTHLNTQNITDISITAAAEYMIDGNFNTLLKSKKLLTLNDTKILIELPYFNVPIKLYEILFNIQIAGYQPILAHPERYMYLHNNYAEFQKLKDAGCLFQLNLLSLSACYGTQIKAIAIKLLKDNLIDGVASDAHNNKHLNYLESIHKPSIVKLVEPLLNKNILLL
ncbi:MAG: histidinol phosphatase [Flavobacteriaceae bacterium]|nr:MAG: histidinol phosphatase [Flavobacteriaceae bacterium]